VREMASPQRENGFTGVANEIMEQILKLHLNGTQYSIVLTVWRFTYGFQRCEHELSITFIAKATGTSPRVIRRELKNLIDFNMILVTKESTKSDSRVLKFNKDYDTWKQRTKQSPEDQIVPSQRTKQSPQQRTKQSPKKETKENSKENIYIVFHHWNSKKIITHRTLTEKISGHISARLEEKYTVNEIIEAIDNYVIILNDNEKYFWSFKWGLNDFLIRGLDKFKTESDPFSNFTKVKGGKNKNERNEGYTGAIASGEAETDEEWPISSSTTRGL